MAPGSHGTLLLLLHAHLPFVRHPEYDDFLEEDWYFEAVVETYGPILRRLDALRSEGLPFKLTFSVTPPLASMMVDPLLQKRLRRYMDARIELLGKELARPAAPRDLAAYYRDELTATRAYVFDRFAGDLTGAFRDFQDSGHLELLTCTATHGFLPLMSGDGARRAQIRTAVRAHEGFFGRKPRGIWLAECGFSQGVDDLLKEAGLEYFFVDAHGILHGTPQPVWGVYAPVLTPAGVTALARDPESSKQVWSQQEGYPGDFSYREFYRDLGYDGDYDYLKPYFHADGVRRGIGIKYQRITGGVPLDQKAPYDRVAAFATADAHAADFAAKRSAQAREIERQLKRPALLVAPYDAELFGHWWFEGPEFLERLIRRLAGSGGEVSLGTAPDFIAARPERQVVAINPSTWGEEGQSKVWLNTGNAWMYRHQHAAEKTMEELARRHPNAGGVLRRALNQLLRDLLLLQSSDWAFILTTGTTVPYATKRFNTHVDRFRRLAAQIEENAVDETALSALEAAYPIFPAIDYRDVLPPA